VTECTALSNYSEKWNKTLAENATIPESVIGDIESSVGQAKLLLDSKLPQFAELLWFYLSRAMNPHPTLACDLEGWWAVAEISVRAIKLRNYLRNSHFYFIIDTD